MTRYLATTLTVTATLLALTSCTEPPPRSKTRPVTIKPLPPETVVPSRKDPAGVAVVRDGQGWKLMRNGKPYYVRGAGGSSHMDVLAKSGGNTTRTWGADAKTGTFLDEAHSHGLAVTVGIWLGHERHGFDYADAAAVRRQFDGVTKWIRTYKDHPAVLVWGIGNEMEGGGDNPKVWQAIEDIARAAKEIDPDHPTMTVIAEIGGSKIPNLHRYCPSIDIVGINSYGGAPSMPDRYRKAGGTKPYIVTEYGPLGTWEVGKSAWGAIHEQTSTEKATWYANTYRALQKDAQLCLGSHAFVWGWKQEATPTWFGMFLPDGTRLAAVDALAELWSGAGPANRCPTLTKIAVVGTGKAAPGATVRVDLAAGDPEGDTLRTKWKLLGEAGAYNTQGDRQAAPPSFRNAIQEVYDDGVVVKMPSTPGKYRLYAYVHDGKGGAATANVPLLVEGSPVASGAPRSTMPMAVYADGARSDYTPSGWMGDTGAISMDPKHTGNPRSGRTCLKVGFSKTSGWGGVVWQHPANDWGDKPGGFDLSDARALSFWARGESGGEVVTVSLGVIGPKKKHHDSSKSERKLTLTRAWKRYRIDLTGKDLSRIKTGFCWTVAAKGKPLTFYFDDVQYTAE